MTTTTPTDEYSVTVTHTINRAALRSLIEDLGFDFYWASRVKLIWGHPSQPDTALIVGWYDDGETWVVPPKAKDGDTVTLRDSIKRTFHERQVTFQMLADGLAKVAAGGFAAREYTTAARDYLHDIDEGDGDYFFSDVLLQAALFDRVVFG